MSGWVSIEEIVNRAEVADWQPLYGVRAALHDAEVRWSFRLYRADGDIIGEVDLLAEDLKQFTRAPEVAQRILDRLRAHIPDQDESR